MEEAALFWERVKDLCKSQGIRQKQLCQECKISESTFRHWGIRNVYPSAKDSVSIARLLHTTVEYLVTGENGNPAARELAELKERLRPVLEMVTSPRQSAS